MGIHQEGDSKVSEVEALASLSASAYQLPLLPLMYERYPDEFFEKFLDNPNGRVVPPTEKEIRSQLSKDSEA